MTRRGRPAASSQHPAGHGDINAGGHHRLDHEDAAGRTSPSAARLTHSRAACDMAYDVVGSREEGFSGAASCRPSALTRDQVDRRRLAGHCGFDSLIPITRALIPMLDFCQIVTNASPIPAVGPAFQPVIADWKGSVPTTVSQTVYLGEPSASGVSPRLAGRGDALERVHPHTNRHAVCRHERRAVSGQRLLRAPTSRCGWPSRASTCPARSSAPISPASPWARCGRIDPNGSVTFEVVDAFAGVVAAAVAMNPHPLPVRIARLGDPARDRRLRLCRDFRHNRTADRKASSIRARHGFSISVGLARSWSALGRLLIARVDIRAAASFNAIVALFAVALIMVTTAQPPRVSAVAASSPLTRTFRISTAGWWNDVGPEQHPRLADALVRLPDLRVHRHPEVSR